MPKHSDDPPDSGLGRSGLERSHGLQLVDRYLVGDSWGRSD